MVSLFWVVAPSLTIDLIRLRDPISIDGHDGSSVKVLTMKQWEAGGRLITDSSAIVERENRVARNDENAGKFANGNHTPLQFIAPPSLTGGQFE